LLPLPGKTKIKETTETRMTFQNFTIDTDADGIALVTWNMPGRSMNVIDEKVTEELAAIVERVATDGAIKGAVLTSGKDSFCGGADLTMLETLSRTFAELTKSQGGKPQTSGCSTKPQAFADRPSHGNVRKPWAAALNGTAMGGGFELALACHHRVAADSDKTRLGCQKSKSACFRRRRHATDRAHAATGGRLQFLLKGDQLR
jgi:3-hydroxyacyl-CoA dehydrogenase/enoyl-CoA hydratase/3-hydroxybutyryl-CoA epimerase